MELPQGPQSDPRVLGVNTLAACSSDMQGRDRRGLVVVSGRGWAEARPLALAWSLSGLNRGACALVSTPRQPACVTVGFSVHV